MKLTLPLPPNRANAREHWRTTDRRKRQYYERVQHLLMRDLEWVVTVVKGKPRIRAKRPETARMRLSATIYVRNRMDRGNAVNRLKWVEDALVNFGLLVDDNEEWLDLQMPTQVLDRKNPRVEIELTPCSTS